jgi:NADPH2:quinone reductase
MSKTMKQLHSTVTQDGKLQLTVATVDKPELTDDEVLIRIEASPINPSDLGSFFGPADMSTATATGTSENPMVVAEVPEHLMPTAAARVDKPVPLGIEGAGIVESAGGSEAAHSLVGRAVALMGGAMYSEYRVAKADQCLVIPNGITPVEAASSFVNPLTTLGMAETMRRGARGTRAHGCRIQPWSDAQHQ